MKQFAIEFNTDYGVEKRSGWTVTVDGSVVAELCSTLEKALTEARVDIDFWELQWRPTWDERLVELAQGEHFEDFLWALRELCNEKGEPPR